MPRPVLLVEDDPAIVEFIRLGLGYEGYEVLSAASTREALAALRNGCPELIILDLTLPDGSGADLLATVRRSGETVPVIILSARDDVRDRVQGLNAGADDYLTKPFRFEELLARMRAVLRRHHPDRVRSVLECGAVRMDLDRHEVTVDGVPVDIGGREFTVLELLMQNVGRVLTREVLADRLWTLSTGVESNAIEAYISRLRRRLGPDGRTLIRTVRGVGYVMRASV